MKKTSLTEVVQKCKDVVTPDCKAVVDHIPDQECFTVDDVACDLIEHPQHEVVPEIFYVQKCFTESAQVCDLTHGAVSNEKNTVDCIKVETSECWEEEKVVKDEECCYSMELNCKKSVKGQKCHMEPRKDVRSSPEQCMRRNADLRWRRSV